MNYWNWHKKDKLLTKTTCFNRKSLKNNISYSKVSFTANPTLNFNLFFGKKPSIREAENRFNLKQSKLNNYQFEKQENLFRREPKKMYLCKAHSKLD